MQITVAGGTRAGWRKVKALASLADWICPGCGARLRYFWNPCPSCKHPRP